MSEIQSCIDELLPLDEAANELLLRQGSVAGPTPVPLVDMYSTSSIRRGPIRNNPPPRPAVIPGNIPRNPAIMPGIPRPPGGGPQFSPSPSNVPRNLVRNNDEELIMRSNARIDHASTSSIRRRNDSSQSIRRILPPQAYDQGRNPAQRIEPEIMVGNDSEVSIRVGNRNSGRLDTFTLNRQSIGANFEEAYENITINQRRRNGPAAEIQVPPPPPVPESDEPQQIIIHPIAFLHLLAEEGDPVAAIILMRILAEMYQPQGVSEEKLQTLNRVVFQKTMKMNCETCVICYDDFVNGVEIIILPCEHPFHSECIGTWLESSKLCPLCKANLEE